MVAYSCNTNTYKRLRQEDFECEVSLGLYKGTLSQKQKKDGKGGAIEEEERGVQDANSRPERSSFWEETDILAHGSSLS